MSDLRRALAARSTLLPGLADPADADTLLRLLRLLYDVGRADLPLGRLLEGHVDASQIIHRYGDAAQRARAAAAVAG
ncbi:hypothetical protein FHY02_004525, partial [Sphingomonas sp. BK069]|nr:hypothetical protein [Sphingomonas sp. BK069]